MAQTQSVQGWLGDNSLETELFQEFYEVLVLHSILDSPDKIRRVPQPTPWHRFLDDVCFLCDTETGGESVASTAVESQRDHLVFWISNNGGPNPRALENLDWLLGQLRDVCHLSESQLLDREKAIFERCIWLSHQRVGNYRRQLVNAIKRLEYLQEPSFLRGERARTTQTNHGTDRLRPVHLLLQSVRRLTSNSDCFIVLCRNAYLFRKQRDIALLNRLAEDSPDAGEWSAIRHFIGRMGSWLKAVKFILRVARRSPDLLRNYTTESVPQEFGTLSPRIETSTQRTDTLEYIHSRQTQEGISPDNEDDVRKHSAELYYDKWECLGRGTKIHAEVVMLEHFAGGNRAFLNDDRYIGCSKPSCYCCEGYFRHHPSQFELRPCHGNVWVRWSPPIWPLHVDQSYVPPTRQIIMAMKVEIEAAIENNPNLVLMKDKLLRDSITNLSSSLESTTMRMSA